MGQAAGYIRGVPSKLEEQPDRMRCETCNRYGLYLLENLAVMGVRQTAAARASLHLNNSGSRHDHADRLGNTDDTG